MARKAALALSGSRTDDDDSFTTKLLRALRQDFLDENQHGADGFQDSNDICNHLNQDNEAPWKGSKFKNGMTPVLLASQLARYKVKSRRQTAGARLRGFYWKDLKPVFDRYL